MDMDEPLSWFKRSVLTAQAKRAFDSGDSVLIAITSLSIEGVAVAGSDGIPAYGCGRSTHGPS